MSEKIINNLVEELVHCHFDVSFNFREGNDPEKIRMAKDILKNPNIAKKPTCRNIVIIGAGLSFSTYQIPLAKKAASEIKNSLGVSEVLKKDYDPESPNLWKSLVGSFKTKFLEEEEKLSILANVKELDFESQLSTLANFFSVKEIRQKLKEIYNYRYNPCLDYYLIAHMFKHRFIDVIINFNFDELLDQAIEEELRDSDYNYIISDGHCEELSELVINDRLKVPIYIKPHGTVSHKSTMRFTKDDYFGLALDMSKQIEDLISGSLGPRSGRKNVQKINLMVFGFGMNSVEFNAILRKKLHRNSSIYFFDPYEDGLNTYNEYVSKGNSHFIKGGDQVLTSNLLSLWSKVRSSFKEEVYEPRDLWRPQIVCSFFHRPEQKTRYPKSDIEYFFQRTIVEIVISLAIGKGKVHLSDLINDRVGIYHKQYLKLHQEIKDTNYPKESEVIKRWKRPEIELVSIHHIVERLLKLKRNDVFSRDLYSHLDFHKEDILSYEDQFVIKLKKRLTDTINGLKNLLFEPIEVERIWDENMNESFKYLLTHSAYDVCPKFSDLNFYLKSDHKKENVLNTRLSLKANLLDQFKSKDWDLVLMVSERGTLLLSLLNEHQEIFSNAKRKCSFILAENTFEKALTKRFSDYFLTSKSNSNGISYLPYWLHDYHMTLFLKRTNIITGNKKYDLLTQCGWEVTSGLYFKVYQNNTAINPIKIDGSRTRNIEKNGQILVVNNPDRLFLTRMFYAYKLKSSSKSQFSESIVLNDNEQFDSDFVNWLKSLHLEFEHTGKSIL